MKYLIPILFLILIHPVSGSTFLSLNPEPLPLPELNENTKTMLPSDIEQFLERFEKKIGFYPPALSSEKERDALYKQWCEVLLVVEHMKAKSPESDQLLAYLARLYRQGNNMHVTDCYELAVSTLSQGLARYPDSIPLNLEASFFYLQSSPEFIPLAEKSCLKLRELLKTDENLDVEDGLLWVYIYKKMRTEALLQIDHCIQILEKSDYQPDFKKEKIENYRKLKNAVAADRLELRESK